MSTFVLEDIGASTPGKPLRLRFDNSGNNDVDFEVADDGELFITLPDERANFLENPATGVGGMHIRIIETGFPFIAGDVVIRPITANAAIGPLENGGQLGAGVFSNSPLFARTDPEEAIATCRLLNASTIGSREILVLDYTDATPNDEISAFCFFDDSTNTKAQCWSNGDWENQNNNYGGISDVSLKQDIVDADPQSQWDDLKAMRFRKWRFKADVAARGDDARTCLGAVGQEMQAVSPGLVRTSTVKKVMTESVSANGKETTNTVEYTNDGPPMLSISYSVLYMKGMVALQEAMRRIEVLEALHP